MTVVVPARNEEAFIGDCLASIQRQSHPELQIIVVDGASTDRTADIVREFASSDPRIELIVNDRQIIPISLNLATAAARGLWLVRVDAHCTVPADYVERALEHLRTGRWGGVGGRKDGVGRTTAGEAIAVAMASRFGVGNSTYHHGTQVQTVGHIPFGCYPVELVRDLGGWDEDLRVNQDYEFDQRVQKSGRELLFDPALRIDWHCRQSIGALFRQYRRYGRGKIRVMRMHPDAVRVRQVAPAGLVAALAGAALLAPIRPRLAAVIAAPYAAFLALGAAREHAALDSPAAKVRLPAAFAAMHLGWGVGLWNGVVDWLAGTLDDRDAASS